MTDGRNSYDQPINDIIKQYDELTKIPTGYGGDYTTGAPTILINKIIDTPPLVALKTFKAWSI